jgi:hypothetical protein
MKGGDPMGPTVLDAKDSAAVAEDKGTTSAWHNEATSWMSQRPEPATVKGTACGDKCEDKITARVEDVETPEVKAAY